MSGWTGEVASATGGVKAFEIAGRMSRQRERLYYPMTDEERRWRAQFIKDQQLEHGESADNFYLNEDYYLATRNVFRRIYQIPMNIFQKKLLEPRFGKLNSLITRNLIARTFIAIGVIMSGHYYLKYNRHKWEHNWGWDVYLQRDRIYPGDPSWPHAPELKKEDFYDRGFSKSTLYPKGK